MEHSPHSSLVYYCFRKRGVFVFGALLVSIINCNNSVALQQKLIGSPRNYQSTPHRSISSTEKVKSNYCTLNQWSDQKETLANSKISHSNDHEQQSPDQSAESDHYSMSRSAFFSQSLMAAVTVTTTAASITIGPGKANSYPIDIASSRGQQRALSVEETKAITSRTSEITTTDPITTDLLSLLLSSSSSSAGTTTTKSLEESISGFVAGAALAGTKTLVKYPLDTATVRLQMPNSKYSIFDLVSLFNGSFNGITAPLASNIPGGAIFFAVRDYVKEVLNNSPYGSNMPLISKTAIAVLVAQFPYWLVRNPSEVVKTRQQANLDGFGDGVSAIEAFQKVRAGTGAQNPNQKGDQQIGLKEFYLGYWENIAYAYPADLIKFACYDRIKKNSGKKLSAKDGAIAGGIATAVAQFVTTPLDVVRNRIMARKNSSPTSLTETTDEEYNDNNNNKQSSGLSSYVESFQTIAKEEGLKGLFAGVTPRVGKAIVSGAVQFATYEETKTQLANYFQSRRQ